MDLLLLQWKEAWVDLRLAGHLQVGGQPLSTFLGTQTVPKPLSMAFLVSRLPEPCGGAPPAVQSLSARSLACNPAAGLGVALETLCPVNSSQSTEGKVSDLDIYRLLLFCFMGWHHTWTR